MDPNEEYMPIKDFKHCFVPACKNSSKDAQKTFFAVPNSNKLEWCNAVGITCPKRVVYICEDHLNLEEDVENYRYWITMKGRPKLKSRLPQSLVQTPSLIQVCQKMDEPIASTSSTPLMEVDIIETLPKHLPSLKVHKGVQVKAKTSDRTTHCSFPKSKVKNIPFIEDDYDVTEDALPSTQGSTTSADISEVSSEVNIINTTHGRTFMLNLIAKKPQSYIGLPKSYYWLIEYLELHHKIKSFDIIVSLYKIKNNIPFFQIADMFEVSLTTLWRIFFKTLCFLSKFFKMFIYSPSVYQIKRNLPSSFRSNKEYANVFCIIDCFEIAIEKPSNPITQALTWSQYKNANTLKYLLATTPDGFVIFVSAGFGGRISDAQIVESSGLLNALPTNSTVLADRGFKHVDTLLSKKAIKLLRPPSVSKGIKLTKQEAIKSKVIASLRIHVERVIRRVRLFKLLKPHSVINNKLIQHADEMIIVACGLINLNTSIIKSE